MITVNQNILNQHIHTHTFTGISNGSMSFAESKKKVKEEEKEQKMQQRTSNKNTTIFQTDNILSPDEVQKVNEKTISSLKKNTYNFTKPYKHDDNQVETAGQIVKIVTLLSNDGLYAHYT
jgi:hypothetical protein